MPRRTRCRAAEDRSRRAWSQPVQMGEQPEQRDPQREAPPAEDGIEVELHRHGRQQEAAKQQPRQTRRRARRRRLVIGERMTAHQLEVLGEGIRCEAEARAAATGPRETPRFAAGSRADPVVRPDPRGRSARRATPRRPASMALDSVVPADQLDRRSCAPEVPASMRRGAPGARVPATGASTPSFAITVGQAKLAVADVAVVSWNESGRETSRHASGLRSAPRLFVNAAQTFGRQKAARAVAPAFECGAAAHGRESARTDRRADVGRVVGAFAEPARRSGLAVGLGLARRDRHGGPPAAPAAVRRR